MDLNCPFKTQEAFAVAPGALDGPLTSFCMDVGAQNGPGFSVGSLFVSQNIKDWHLTEYKSEANVIRG